MNKMGLPVCWQIKHSKFWRDRETELVLLFKVQSIPAKAQMYTIRTVRSMIYQTLLNPLHLSLFPHSPKTHATPSITFPPWFNALLAKLPTFTPYANQATPWLAPFAPRYLVAPN